MRKNEYMEINKKLLIYVVEDNKMYNKIISGFLKKTGFDKVKSFLNGEDCIEAVKGGEYPDIVIQDYDLTDITGIDVLQYVKKHSRQSEFIFLTANESMEVGVNSIKYGAYDYIIKDNDLALNKVLNKIDNISKLIQLQKRNRRIMSAMIFVLVILIGIVILTTLHTYFDAFGWQP